MAEKLTDVLDSAKLLLDGKSEFIKGDIKLKTYAGGKVRVFGLTPADGPDVLLAGDALPSDAADAKKATNFFSQDDIDTKLKAVVELASGEVKPPAKTAAPSS